jgi:hypothetical protein
LILDTNVVIAILDPDSPDVIRKLINALRAEGELHVNEIIFAELSRAYVDAAEVEAMLAAIGVGIARLALPDCHRAGQAFAQYRQRGGTRTAILSDFLIGAQAATRGWPLVTRDPKGFASYFPELTIIDPLEDIA